MTNFYEGQAVLLFSVNSRFSRITEEDPGTPGFVTKVGRKRVTIKSEGGIFGEQQYDMEFQRVCDKYGHEYFRTHEQQQEHLIRQACIGVIHAYGLSWRNGQLLVPTVQLEELAGLIGSFAVKPS
jgi:hypothetical protein